MLNDNISDWSVFQAEAVAGNANAFSLDSNGVLTVTSSSSSQRNIVGAMLVVTQGDILRFEVDAYAPSGTKATVTVQLGAMGQYYTDIAGAPTRSTEYVPQGKWSHCVVTYRVPLNIVNGIANACCGFSAADTGSAKFRNPKVFINNTQQPLNNPLSQLVGTSNNYLQFIGNKAIDIDSNLTSLNVDSNNNAKNRILHDCGGARCQITLHEAIVASKRYNALPARFKFCSSGSSKIGTFGAGVDNQQLACIEFWGEGTSSELSGGEIMVRQRGTPETNYINTDFVFKNGVTGKGVTNSLIIYGTTGNHAVTPGIDNEQYLGSAGYRWNTFFCASGTINTSDERVKENIEEPSDALMRAWGKVGFKVFQLKDAVEKKGVESARVHVGVIAQEVQEAFASEGLNASNYGLFCYDEWEDEYEDEKIVDQEAVVDEMTGEITPAVMHVERRLVRPAGNRYGIRYEEALALECAYQRWLGEKRDARIAALEARLNDFSGSDSAPSGASPNNL